MGNSITDTNAAWNKTPFLVKERESLGTKPLGPCPLWVNVMVRVRNRVESPVVRHPFSRTLRLNVGARVHFRFQDVPSRDQCVLDTAVQLQAPPRVRDCGHHLLPNTGMNALDSLRRCPCRWILGGEGSAMK
jgi:hypothetical protein